MLAISGLEKESITLAVKTGIFKGQVELKTLLFLLYLATTPQQ